MILTVCANPSVDSFWSFFDINKATTNRSQQEKYFPGGKGLHTAFALAELDQEVTTLGVWGGQTGQWLRRQCNQKNISTIGPTVEPWNRLCITVKSDSEWSETEFLGQGPQLSRETVKNFKKAYKECISQNEIAAIIISGSVPAGFPDDIYFDLVAEASRQHVPVFVDASGDLLSKAITAHPLGIHINHKEGQALSKKENPVEIAKWLSEHCDIAALTAGAEGLFLVFQNKILHAHYSIDDADIFSTIGCGDCLLAGLSLAYLKNDELSHWARYAVACGSANCLHPALGMLRAEDVEEIIPKVTVIEK